MRQNIIISLFIFSVFCIQSQNLKTYKKLKKVGKNKFNYLVNVDHKYDNSKKLIFSDRNNNFCFKTKYIQEKTEKINFLDPLYVIRENKDAYEVVLASPDMIGKPEGFFSFLYTGKLNFKDFKSVKYLGWILKKNTLKYNHSFLNDTNNKPFRYKLGTDDVTRLNNLKPFMKVDSVFLFKDPYLKEKSDSTFISNQIIFPYKFSRNKKTVLISKKSIIKDSTDIIGWVPSNLIVPIGQSKVYKIRDYQSIIKINDSLRLNRNEVFSNFLYPTYLKDSLIKLTAPLHVWDHNENKFINIKGNNFYSKDIPSINKQFKRVNIHFIFKSEKPSKLKKMLNSLQSVYISTIKDKNENNFFYSAIIIDKNRSLVFKKTPSFSNWIDFLEEFSNGIESIQSHCEFQRLSIPNAIEYSLDNFTDNLDKFENNIFIISGVNTDNNEFKNVRPNLFKKIGRKSSKILFVQLDSKKDETYQNYLLGAKDFLRNTSESYNSFISNYIIDTKLYKRHNKLSKVNINSDNIYIFDSPENSLFNGGIMFPKIGRSLEVSSFPRIFDTILHKTNLTNRKLLNSLNYYNKKLGVLRTKPSSLIRRLFSNSNYPNYINKIDRNNLNEIIYYKFNTINNKGKYDEGYILSKNELLDLIANLKTFFPLITKPMTKRKRRGLKKSYKSYIKIINNSALRKLLRKNSSIDDLFHATSGIHLTHDGFRCLKIKKITRKFVKKSNFRDFYYRQYEKVNFLEELFLKNKLEVVKNPFHSENVYFIPSELLP